MFTLNTKHIIVTNTNKQISIPTTEHNENYEQYQNIQINRDTLKI
jgi:hypothetical protein